MILRKCSLNKTIQASSAGNQSCIIVLCLAYQDQIMQHQNDPKMMLNESNYQGVVYWKLIVLHFSVSRISGSNYETPEWYWWDVWEEQLPSRCRSQSILLGISCCVSHFMTKLCNIWMIMRGCSFSQIYRNSASHQKPRAGHPITKGISFGDPATMDANIAATQATSYSIGSQVRAFNQTGKNISDLKYRMAAGMEEEPA